MKRWSILICVFGLLLTTGTTGAEVEKDYSGIWQGILKVPGQEVRLVFKIEKAADDTFDAQLELRLLAQAERAEDLDVWVELLSPEPERVPRKSILAFAGNWDSPSGDKVTRWIAHADGRMEIVGKPWKAKWIILENGILEVRWSDKAPYVYTRDGAGWISKAPHLRKLTRGDW